MITRKQVLKNYRISGQTFKIMIDKLPDHDKAELNILSKKRILDSRQVKKIKEIFGDWEKHSFYTKQELTLLYGVSSSTFRKMLIEALGRNHEIVQSCNKLLTSKQVEIIETAIGEP